LTETRRSSTDEATSWWQLEAPKHGLEYIDTTVRGGASWADVLESGRAELAKAIEVTHMLTGSALRALEIGCGVGRLTFALAQKVGSVVAVDVAPALLAVARAHNDLPQVEFREITGLELAPPAETASYDLVFSYEVFHHLEFEVIRAYLREARRLLRRDGQLVFEVNTMPRTWKTRISLLVRRALHHLGVRRWRGWPTAPGFSRRSYSVAQIRAALVDAGLRVDQAHVSRPAQTWFVATPDGARDS
jgi:2-polyprenyl-3-methyl-5-hydroxy-6-metoxy-1,4-benzoquinol methylase